MEPTIPYFTSVIGAAALYLLLRPGSRGVKAAAILLGLGAFIWLLLAAGNVIGGDSGPEGTRSRPQMVFLIFSLIAVASAVRMITHSRPVYSALYFVMVVLSSAGLFLLLQAEFMAFALIIVYAGAILITYMFVLMLAQPAPTDGQSGSALNYDAIPREPGYAAGVGFIMLALFTHMVFAGGGTLRPHATPEQASLQTWQAAEMLPGHLQATVQRSEPNAVVATPLRVHVAEEAAFVDILRPGESQAVAFALPPEAMPTNIQLVGLDLVAAFPVSLELAGIILLLAMFGAVVLARKQIELGEDEIREAAGMRRLAFHSDELSEPSQRDGDTSRGVRP